MPVVIARACAALSAVCVGVCLAACVVAAAGHVVRGHCVALIAIASVARNRAVSVWCSVSLEQDRNGKQTTQNDGSF